MHLINFVYFSDKITPKASLGVSFNNAHLRPQRTRASTVCSVTSQHQHAADRGQVQRGTVLATRKETAAGPVRKELRDAKTSTAHTLQISDIHCWLRFQNESSNGYYQIIKIWKKTTNKDGRLERSAYSPRLESDWRMDLKCV